MGQNTVVIQTFVYYLLQLLVKSTHLAVRVSIMTNIVLPIAMVRSKLSITVFIYEVIVAGENNYNH